MKAMLSFSLKVHFLWQYVPSMVLLCCMSLLALEYAFPFAFRYLTKSILLIVLQNLQVPNTIEFADWIGRTKQKKIRVTG